MRVVVAGWIGSENLGDELVFAGLRRHLGRLGVEAIAVSRDPPATAAAHDVEAVGTDARGLVAAVRSANAMVFGGGGLLQDQTSPFNVPYHLARPGVARLLRRPVVGVGLGAGGLDGRLGRRLTRLALPRFAGLTVRDEATADLLADLGVRRPIVAADLALALPEPRVPATDRLVVTLRPWSGRRHRLPVHRRDLGATTPAWFLAEAATALDRTAAATGLGVRFVALDGERDHAVHQAVADRMTEPVSAIRPALDEVVDEVARGRVVVAMRYHAGIAAVLGARPTVLVGYSSKVASLADDVGPSARALPWERGALAPLPEAVAAVADRAGEAAEARTRLRDREHANAEALDRLLS